MSQVSQGDGDFDSRTEISAPSANLLCNAVNIDPRPPGTGKTCPPDRAGDQTIPPNGPISQPVPLNAQGDCPPDQSVPMSPSPSSLVQALKNHFVNTPQGTFLAPVAAVFDRQTTGRITQNFSKGSFHKVGEDAGGKWLNLR